MTKAEFFRCTPADIQHKEYGYGKLEIVANSKLSKGACYRHLDKTASGGSYGASWEEVDQKLREYRRRNAL